MRSQPPAPLPRLSSFRFTTRAGPITLKHGTTWLGFSLLPAWVGESLGCSRGAPPSSNPIVWRRVRLRRAVRGSRQYPTGDLHAETQGRRASATGGGAWYREPIRG